MTFQFFLEYIALWDVRLFRFINSTLMTPWLSDFTYLFARDQFIILFLLSTAFFYLAWRGWAKIIPLTLWGIIAVIATNLVHNHLLKPFFNRPRPFITLDHVQLSAPLRDLSMVSLSFPSTHAASSAALAIVMMKIDKSLKWPAVIFALTVGFFTVYSGGHYPFDVLAGYAVGWCIGMCLIYISRFIWPKQKQIHFD